MTSEPKTDQQLFDDLDWEDRRAVYDVCFKAGLPIDSANGLFPAAVMELIRARVIGRLVLGLTLRELLEKSLCPQPEDDGL